ncbi:MAG: glycoside hydrolase family 2 [Bacteroidales bacterium]|nr:glycoside hydrolase family 2 [Bacteroidales bacterium]
MKRNTSIISAVLMSVLLFSLTASTVSAERKPSSKDLWAQFQKPDNRYRPFVRWWWNGDRVQADEIRRELNIMKAAGIGGVEINPIVFPGGDDTLDTKPLTWLSDEWIDMLKVAFDEAERIGMTCDLIIGSGWPFGSETLPREECASVMLTYAEPVKGGERLEISKFHIYKALDPGVTKVNPRRTAELVAMYLAPDPMSDLSQAIDVTDKFNGDVLDIEVPKGKWQMYALVKYRSFASVICGAPGAAGSILNHMDAKAVRNYLDHMADAIEAKIGPLSEHLRAFFVDSMELEGSNWTDDFAEEFKARRGYDVMPWLPFIMFKTGRLGDVESFEYGSKKSPEFLEQLNRVRFDFELTKAELLHERYTETFLAWCKEKGVKSRAQAYGRGFFPLESSLGYDLPEGESWTTNWLRHRIGEEMGDEDYRRGRGYTMIDKYVSSAAHLSGNRIVSCEEMTNTYKVFTTSLEFLKVGSDMAAEAGITHSVWHGFNYSPIETEFPGWVQYGTFHNERNTWWPYAGKLNDYRARMCSQLQNADMYTDIAILPANYDMWSEMGVQTEPFPVKLNVPYTSLIWEAIHKNGGGADYVSEIIIRDAQVRGGKLCYGAKEYGTLFLVEVTSTTPETLAKLEEFVKGGGRVFCVAKYPEKSLGLVDFQARDRQIAEAVERLKSYKDNFILLNTPEDGKFLEWYTGVMEEYSLPHAITVSSPDRYLLQNHYVTDDRSDMFLFVNANMSEARASQITFPKSITSGKNAWVYDIASGKRYVLPVSKDGKVDLKLGPSESCFIVFNKLSGKAPVWSPLPVSGNDVVEVKGWNLKLHQPQTDSTWTASMEALKDFKDMAEPEFKNFMGTIVYTAEVSVSGSAMPRYINLGKVADICELKVNGKDLGTDWFGDRIYDVSGALHEGTNTIEVKVTTLMGNYIQTLKDNKVAQRFVLKRNQPYVSAGLIGPVMLYR